MFCTNCGKEIPEGSTYCAECGVQINSKISAVVTETELVKEGFNIKAPHNMISLVGAIFSVLALFLPFRKVSILGTTISVSIMQGQQEDVIGGILLMAVIGLAVWLMYKEKPIGYLITSLVVTGVGLLLVIAENSSLKEQLGNYSLLVSHGWGFYLMIIGPILMVLAGVVLLKKA